MNDELPIPPAWGPDHPALQPQRPEQSDEEADRRYQEALRRRRRREPLGGPVIDPADFGVLGSRSPSPAEWLREP